MPALVCVATSALPLWPLYIRYRNLPASPLLGSVLRHTQLEVLQLAHCGLVGLPQELTGFTRLRELGIQGKGVSCVRGREWRQAGLAGRSLASAQHCPPHTLPMPMPGNLLMSDEDWAPVVLALTQLEALDVSACQLSHLPDLRLLSRLHTLRLLGNTSWRLATGGAQQWLQLLELPQLRELSLDISVLECWPGYRALISQNDLAQQLIARGVRLAAQVRRTSSRVLSCAWCLHP